MEYRGYGHGTVPTWIAVLVLGYIGIIAASAVWTILYTLVMVFWNVAGFNHA